MDFIGIFEIVVLSSFIGSIIVLVLLAIKRVFKNNLNSTFHYYIWMILILKLIIPFGPQSHLIFPNIHKSIYIQPNTNENTQKIQIKSPLKLENGNINYSTLANTIHSQNKSSTNTIVNTFLENSATIEKGLCFLWILGIIFLTGVLVLGYKKLKEIVSASIKDINYSNKKILHDCKNVMNIRSHLKLFYSSQISSPSLCGFIKPKILIPITVADNVSDEEFKYILMHELYHFKNKDILINSLITLLSVIYWFNPLLLYGFQKIRQNCEIHCDYQVISNLNQGENVQYGNTIIRVLGLAQKNKMLIGTTPMVMNNSGIKRRIIMISRYKKPSIKNILLGGIIITIIGGLSITLNTSSIGLCNNSKAAEIHAKASEITTKSNISSMSNDKLLDNIKALQTNKSNPVAPFSADIVIYNSHPDEDYKLASGIKVSELGALINDKLVKEGLNSKFLPCTAPKEYTKSYYNSRDLIKKNVKNYSNTVLLDIHGIVGLSDAEADKSKAKTITFVFAKESPYYKDNFKFANCIVDNIKRASKIQTNTIYFNKGNTYFNQDLSNKSVLIEIGNDFSTEKDIKDCIDTLVLAIKNTQKLSSK
ncbi:M56 family metallopeptidase [Clostridium sp. JS66]|uniref:M56 family metallopeptidase n=1 Tax=Clostridium sp. JS66 TaxID=3064705 RepID=UPI00298D783B|nr:M56 family metallopeptidase [Clostridium sp. JS66]WPC44000.1 M56 family metallopeptidase [Clostridium sp. JS66]